MHHHPALLLSAAARNQRHTAHTHKQLHPFIHPLATTSCPDCSQVLWIPEYFKARGAHSASLYAETFAVAAANLPGVCYFVACV